VNVVKNTEVSRKAFTHKLHARLNNFAALRDQTVAC